MTENEFVRPADAAKLLKLSQSTLAKMRVHGTGPRYTKAGNKLVLYNVDDLHSWLLSRTRHSTSEV